MNVSAWCSQFVPKKDRAVLFDSCREMGTKVLDFLNAVSRRCYIRSNCIRVNGNLHEEVVYIGGCRAVLIVININHWWKAARGQGHCSYQPKNDEGNYGVNTRHQSRLGFPPVHGNLRWLAKQLARGHKHHNRVFSFCHRRGSTANMVASWIASSLVTLLICNFRKLQIPAACLIAINDNVSGCRKVYA